MALSLIRPMGTSYPGPIRRSRHRAINAASGAWRSVVRTSARAPPLQPFFHAIPEKASRQPAFQNPVAHTMAHSTAHRGKWSASVTYNLSREPVRQHSQSTPTCIGRDLFCRKSIGNIGTGTEASGGSCHGKKVR